MPKTPAIRLICVDCKKEAKPDKKKSTANWNVLPASCIHCGGRFKIKLD